MTQNPRNRQPVGTKSNALDLQGGFPLLDGGPPISASSTTSDPPLAPALLDDMTTASVISHSITSGHLSVYPFLVRREITKSSSAEFMLTTPAPGKAIRAFDSHFDPSSDFYDSPNLGLRGDAVPIKSRAHADFVQASNGPLIFPPPIVAPDNRSSHTFSAGSSIRLTSPFPSLRQQSTPTNVPVPFFPLTPNTYGYVAVPSTVDPRQLLMSFDSHTITSDPTCDGPAQIGGTVSEICSNELQMHEQGRGSTLYLPGPEYQTELQRPSGPPNLLAGWSISQSPYLSLSDVLSPKSPSRFQVPPESPSAPPTPALLSPGSVSTLHGTPPVLGSPLLHLSVPSYSNAQHSVHLHKQAALPGSRSRKRVLSYAEILSRDAPSAPPVVPYSPQPISVVESSISARPLHQSARPQNTHLHLHRRAPSRLCNVVPVPSEPINTVDQRGNAGLSPILPHPPVLTTPDPQNDAGKVAYTGPKQINLSQHRRYSDAVKGKTKGPISRVKVLHHAPSRPVPTPSSRPHNPSNTSVDRRPRPHSHAGLPYPPSPLPNNLPLHSPPGSVASRSIPGGLPKIKFKGKRQGVDPCLKAAFDDGDPRRILLDRILESYWCQQDEEEPICGSPQDQVTADLYIPTLQLHKSILFAFVQVCTGKDEFQCLICPKRLRLQRVLRHIRSHFDIRPFVCHDCPDCHQSKCAFSIAFHFAVTKLLPESRTVQLVWKVYMSIYERRWLESCRAVSGALL